MNQKNHVAAAAEDNLQSKIGLTLSLIVGQQDKRLYVFQLHSFSLSDEDKSIHQLQEPECMKKMIGAKLRLKVEVI